MTLSFQVWNCLLAFFALCVCVCVFVYENILYKFDVNATATFVNVSDCGCMGVGGEVGGGWVTVNINPKHGVHVPRNREVSPV